MSNRVGPVSPDPNRSQSVTPKTQREQTQRIEKVREVDPDEQTRKRQFQKCMEETDTDQDTTPRVPSPFETQFYTDDASNEPAPELTQGAIPSPKYSPPPKLSSSVPQDESTEELPQSEQFWKGVGLPDQPVAEPKVKAKEEGAQIASSGKVGPKAPLRAETSDEKKAPTARYWELEAQPQGQPVKPEQTRDQKKTAGLPNREPRLEAPEGERDALDKRSKKPSFEEQPTIQPMSMTPMPPDIQTQALQATVPASPYLSPEVLPLFFQMVGSVLVMMAQPKGLQREEVTEITLDSPSYKSSKFYGAKIQIVRFGTALNSFNIRLTGSNDAVSAFRDAIPNLTQAFQQGNFQFRIGRIEAGYTTERAERPIFRRKDDKRGDLSNGSGDLSGGKQ